MISGLYISYIRTIDGYKKFFVFVTEAMKSRDLFREEYFGSALSKSDYKEVIYQYFFTITFIFGASIYDYKQQKKITFSSEAYEARCL